MDGYWTSYYVDGYWAYQSGYWAYYWYWDEALLGRILVLGRRLLVLGGWVLGFVLRRRILGLSVGLLGVGARLLGMGARVLGVGAGILGMGTGVLAVDPWTIRVDRGYDTAKHEHLRLPRVSERRRHYHGKLDRL